MKKHVSRLIVLCLLLSALVAAPITAQPDPCTNAAAYINTLLAHAQSLISQGDEATAEAVVAGAQSLLTQCFDVTYITLSDLQVIELEQGFGAAKDFWEVYFTAPTGSRDSTTYTGGVDTVIVTAIDAVEQTLDIAAFEWNNPRIQQAVLAAHQRGVQVRMVVDDEHALEDDDGFVEDLIDEGVAVVDDGRSGLMHNKFMIMDGTTLWTGSMNYTINGSYRNNNNVVMLRAPEAVAAYQTEFNEMFIDREFGSSRSAINSANFVQDGVPVQVLFAPEDPVVPTLLGILESAESDIRFMTFSFTLDEVGQTLLARAEAGVNVEGIFEVRGSRTQFSQLPLLLCAGLDVRQDGNPFTFHHKVFIIDDDTVVTGSFNISANATNRNDENVLIIQDQDFAAQFIAEYERMYAQSEVPPADQITCPTG